MNHKEYGVTSEGVNVFLDVGLRNVLGIDPTQEPFTVRSACPNRQMLPFWFLTFTTNILFVLSLDQTHWWP